MGNSQRHFCPVSSGNYFSKKKKNTVIIISTPGKGRKVCGQGKTRRRAANNSKVRQSRGGASNDDGDHDHAHAHDHAPSPAKKRRVEAEGLEKGKQEDGPAGN